jgi:hypothetical protein
VTETAYPAASFGFFPKGIPALSREGSPHFSGKGVPARPPLHAINLLTTN